MIKLQCEDKTFKDFLTRTNDLPDAIKVEYVLNGVSVIYMKTGFDEYRIAYSDWGDNKGLRPVDAFMGGSTTISYDTIMRENTKSHGTHIKEMTLSELRKFLTIEML